MTPEEKGRQQAANIARGFGNLACEACVLAVAKSLGKNIPATFEKLVTTDESDPIYLPEKGLLISENGIHLGIRIGELIFDNHYPDGVREEIWKEKYKARPGAELALESRPIADFFGKIFLRKKFRQWSSYKKASGEMP